MGIKHVNFETGIEIWDGLPGSGKSYGVVERLIEIILKGRRPVYTNLPLRLRVLCCFLSRRGGAVAAKYIRQLSKDHYLRFIQRNSLRSEFTEHVKSQGLTDGQAELLFVSANGPDVFEGAEANWFPPFSVFVIDEVHRWFAQQIQHLRNLELQNYVTMHRHHLHWILLVTQDKMQIDIQWRRNCKRVIHCSDKRNLPFMFGLKIPIPAFAYEEYPKEYAADANKGTVPPINTWVRIPWASGGRIWRFYDSFTHLGSFRRLRRKLEQVRERIEGELYIKPNMEVNMKGKKWKLLAICSCALLLGLAISHLHMPTHLNPFAPSGAVAPANSPGPAPAQAVNVPVEKKNATKVSATTQPTEVPFDPVVGVLAPGWCVANGRVVTVGGTMEGWKLTEVNLEIGTTLWLKDGRAPVIRVVGGRTGLPGLPVSRKAESGGGGLKTLTRKLTGGGDNSAIPSGGSGNRIVGPSGESGKASP